MRHRSSDTRMFRGVTLVEMVLAISMMTIILGAVLPLFAGIRNNWSTKQATAEITQNARILSDHLYRRLSQAVRITSVSASTEAAGYIEFTANDGESYRYALVGDYAQFGPVGATADLAGPVSQLRFTCWDISDLDTPTTDVDSVRLIKVEATLTNPAELGNDEDCVASVYLRTNWDSASSDSGQVVYEGFAEAKTGSNGNSVTISTPSSSAAIESTTVSKETDGSNRFVVSMPSARPDDDLYIAQIAQEGGAQITSIPGGWNELTDRDKSGNTRLATYWRMGSSEPATYTWRSDSSKKWIGAIHRISGINTSNPINASGDNTGDSASPTAPSLTTTVDGCLILRMYGAEGDERKSTYWPSGTSGVFQDESSGNVVSGAAYEYQSSAGQTGTGAFSMTGSKKWVAATVAIAPASGGIEEGDLLVAAVAVDGNKKNQLAPPAGQGWIESDLDQQSGVTLGVWWKQADASEASSHQFSWGSSSQQAYGWIMRFAGHDPADPINACSVGGGTSSLPTSPSVTTTVGNCLILRIGGFDDDSIALDSPGLVDHTPVTMDESNSGSGTCSGGAGYVVQEAAGPSGVSNFSLTSSERYRAVTIAIAPNP